MNLEAFNQACKHLFSATTSGHCDLWHIGQSSSFQCLPHGKYKWLFLKEHLIHRHNICMIKGLHFCLWPVGPTMTLTSYLRSHGSSSDIEDQFLTVALYNPVTYLERITDNKGLSYFKSIIKCQIMTSFISTMTLNVFHRKYIIC